MHESFIKNGKDLKNLFLIEITVTLLKK
jgi:hypothetical protein